MTHRWKAVICTALAGMVCLGGCSASQGIHPIVKLDKEAEGEWKSWGVTPVFSYEVSAGQPGILLDQQGYETGAAKTAVLRGRRIPDTFSIIDRSDASVVYTGTIQKKDNQNVFAVFTDFTTPGTYRLECAYLGQSYDFVIEDELYRGHLEEALELLTQSRTSEQGLCLSASPKDVAQSCSFLAKLLQAYELYGENLLTCDGGAQYLSLLGAEAQWLLTMQDASGVVYENQAAKEQAQGEKAASKEMASGEVDPQMLESTARYSAVMAKFGYAYRNEDNAFATACLKASDRAWKYVIANKLDRGSEELFFAAAELYRATGVATYQKYIKEFANAGLPDEETMRDSAFYGTVTYLSTKKGADKAICAPLMKTLSAMGEEISLKAREGACLTTSEEVGTILQDMEVIAVMNHIITNHEYTTVLENHLHYLLGCNLENRDFRQELADSPEEFAQYIELLAAMVSTQ